MDDIYLIKTDYQEFIPAYQSDHDLVRKIKPFTVVRTTIVRDRNYQFFKKYWALMKMAHFHLNEKFKADYPTYKHLEKAVRIEAGHFDVLALVDGTITRLPRSISFKKMTETEFEEHYTFVTNVICDKFIEGISLEDFEQDIEDFM